MYYYIILQRGDVYKVNADSEKDAYEKAAKKHIEIQSADLLDIVNELEYQRKYLHT